MKYAYVSFDLGPHPVQTPATRPKVRTHPTRLVRSRHLPLPRPSASVLPLQPSGESHSQADHVNITN
jgi:hypothetical protein